MCGEVREHWHVWNVSYETRRAAFMSRPFTSKSTAFRHANAIGDSQWRFVVKCRLGKDCPRKPAT